MYLFDASARINLVKKGKIVALAKGSTLYEVINAVWKECYLLKKILSLHTVKGFEKEVTSIALREGVTLYDALYVFLVTKNNLTLITDDKKLASIAVKYTRTTTAEIPS